MEHNAKNICKTVISGKERNLKKQMAECGISILFNSLFTFCMILYSILFPGLVNRFHNSVVFQYSQYLVGTLLEIFGVHAPEPSTARISGDCDQTCERGNKRVRCIPDRETTDKPVL